MIIVHETETLKNRIFDN